MKILACMTIGYFFGTVNPAYLLSKVKGFDVRERGSGNAGATNVFLTIGKISGLLCALLDILKAFLAFRICKALFPAVQYAGILAGSLCVLGHIFPVWMGFRGGKGLACLGGLILAYNWKLFCVMLVLEVALTLMVNYICFMAMSTSVFFTAVYAFVSRDLIGTLALLIVTIVVQCKHIENVKRIMAGTEFHISYIWNKEKEIERVSKIMGRDRVDELI